MLLNAVCAATGIALVCLALRDVFQSVIVPRAISRRWRISARLTRTFWAIWPRISWRIQDDGAREDFLSTFAPFMMIVLFAAWALTLIVGYGLILYAMRTQLHPQTVSFFGALYFAGTSFLTIGFGDITGASGLSRLVSLLAGASGLSVVAVVTAFLFSVFGAFQRREVFVVLVGARAGAPPTGVGLLSIHAYAGILDDLPALFRQGQAWTAEVLESHLAYPMLSFFRSSHDYESWVGTLGALLDASALLLTTVEGMHGQAGIMYEVGRHLTHDFVNYYGLAKGTEVGVERSEFNLARERLAGAAFKLRDEETAWRLFSDLRSTYASGLNAMALFWHIPPVQWVGDRSLIRADHVRRQMPQDVRSSVLR
ncbi:MAG: potassium channel family protein [Candidatus Eremiobacteraeota bacterium]|nr:potassium channel family protein [Candidatus Eremiobacteraeota bacterium]